jgi:hypothetical protein
VNVLAKKESVTEIGTQKSPLDRRHILLYFLLVVGLPLLTHHVLQFFYVGFERKLAFTLYNETGELVLSFLLGCFDVLINFLKSIAVFAALGLLASRMVRAYGTRLTKIGVACLPIALLLPYLASYWLTAVFQYLNAERIGYHTLNIALNWFLDLAIIGFGVLVIYLRRAQIWKKEETDPKDEWLPRKTNPCLCTVLYVTLVSFTVRWIVSLINTVALLSEAGAPQNFSEVTTLVFPYLLLLAQHLVCYLVMAQIARADARTMQKEERSFSRPWMLKKK